MSARNSFSFIEGWLLRKLHQAAGQPPVLIIQGTADHTIPADWTNATYAALQQTGIESKLLWFDGADHDFVGPNLDNAVAAEEAWIRHALSA